MLLRTTNSAKSSSGNIQYLFTRPLLAPATHLLWLHPGLVLKNRPPARARTLSVFFSGKKEKRSGSSDRISLTLGAERDYPLIGNWSALVVREWSPAKGRKPVRFV